MDNRRYTFASIRLNESEINALEQIRRHEGLANRSEIFRMLIREGNKSRKLPWPPQSPQNGAGNDQ